MSLLQDALRRLQNGAPAATAPPPPVRPPSSRSATPKPRRLPIVLGGVAVTCGVVFGMVFLKHAGTSSVALPPRASSAPAPAPAPAAAMPPVVPTRADAAPAAAGGITPLPAAPSPAAVHSAAAIRPTDAAEAAGTRPGRTTGHPAASSPPRGVSAGTAPRDVPAPALPVPAAASPRLPGPLDDYNAGVAAHARGDWEEAAERFRRVVEADPGIVEAWNNLGIALLRRGKTADAKAAFDRALSLDPRYPPGLVNAGLLLMTKDGDCAGAADLFSRAVAADPDAPAARVNLAIAQARLGEAGAALETLSAARRRFPRDPDVLYHLGTSHERAGNRERAAEAYAAFLRESAGARPSRESSVRERIRAWERRP